MGKRRRGNDRPRGHDDDSDGADDGDRLLDKHNVRVIGNRVFFNAEVTHDSVFALNLRLRKLEQEMLAQRGAVADYLGVEDHASLPPAKPIELHITSYGGNVDAAFSAVDCIRGLSVPVHTVVDGYVASAATLISVAGATRSMNPNAFLLIHELRSGFWGKFSEINDEHGNLTKVMDHIVAFYARHTKLSAKKLTKLLKSDVSWNAQECLERGLVDKVNEDGPRSGGGGAAAAADD